MKTDTNFKLLSDDLTFKYVFSHDGILEYFINLFLDYIKSDLRFNVTNTNAQVYIMPNNKEIHLYYGDIVSTLSNGDILSLELYKNNFTLADYNKSYAYKCRMFANQLNKSKKDKIDYKNMKRVISINLIRGNFNRSSNEIVNCYRFKNDVLNVVVKDNTMMYLVRFDMVDKIAYNLNEHKFITCLRMLNAKSVEEIQKYGEGDKIMQEIIDYVFEWNNESSKNGLERLLEDKGHEIANKIVAKATRKAAVEAERKGEDKAAFNIAKNLMSLNIPIEAIEKSTGLSRSKIKSIR